MIMNIDIENECTLYLCSEQGKEGRKRQKMKASKQEGEGMKYYNKKARQCTI